MVIRTKASAINLFGDESTSLILASNILGGFRTGDASPKGSTEHAQIPALFSPQRIALRTLLTCCFFKAVFVKVSPLKVVKEASQFYTSNPLGSVYKGSIC